MTLRLSPNEEDYYYRSKAEELRRDRLLEVRRQTKATDMKSLSDYRDKIDLSNKVALVELRRRELAAKTDELQRLRELRKQAIEAIGSAERAATDRSEILSARRLVESMKSQTRDDSNNERFRQAIKEEREQEARRLVDDSHKYDRLERSRYEAQSFVNDYRATHPPPEKVDVPRILANLESAKRTLLQTEADGFTKLTKTPLKMEISKAPELSAPTQPARQPHVTLQQRRNANERARLAQLQEETRARVEAVEAELDDIREAEVSEKVKSSIAAQKARAEMFSEFRKSRHSDRKVEIFLPKAPPPKRDLEISEEEPSVALSSASIESLVKRYANLLKEFSPTNEGRIEAVEQIDSDEQLVDTWNFKPQRRAVVAKGKPGNLKSAEEKADILARRERAKTFDQQNRDRLRN